MEHKKTHRRYCLKALRADENRREDFDREVSLLARCRQASKVVDYIESFTTLDTLYIVMEYMQAGDLEQQLYERDFEPISERAVRHVLRHLCEAISYLHENEIVHGDIKLENVLLDERDSECIAKLADFGRADFIDSLPAKYDDS